MIGHIYRIIHLESELCYIGSTFNELRKRWQAHKSAFNKWLETGNREVSIFPHFKMYGIDKFKMIPVKEYEVVDRKHLEVYEALWISKFKNVCVNKVVPFGISKLYKKKWNEDNKDRLYEQKKQYVKDNFEKIATYKKKWYNKNKERMLSIPLTSEQKQRRKQYNEDNRETLNQKQRERYKANKDKILAKLKEKITCGCGSMYSRSVQSKHRKSEKHQNWLSLQNVDI